MRNVTLTRSQRLAVDRKAIESRRHVRAAIAIPPCHHKRDCDCWEYGR